MLATVAVVVLMSGCGKEMDEFNKPADYWYEKMIDAVSKGNLEKADGYFSSLQSEHIGSPLLGEATLIMAQAHMVKRVHDKFTSLLNELAPLPTW